MLKQIRLDWHEEGLTTLWLRLPEEARRALLEHYARLIAREAQTQARVNQPGEKRK